MSMRQKKSKQDFLPATSYQLPARHQGGYTMVELVIYAALLAVLSVLVIQALLSLTRTFSEIKASAALRAGAQVGMERMLKEIRFASSVDYAGSALGSSPGRLALNSTDEAGSARTVEFLSASGAFALVFAFVCKRALSRGRA